MQVVFTWDGNCRVRSFGTVNCIIFCTRSHYADLLLLFFNDAARCLLCGWFVLFSLAFILVILCARSMKQLMPEPPLHPSHDLEPADPIALVNIYALGCLEWCLTYRCTLNIRRWIKQHSTGGSVSAWQSLGLSCVGIVMIVMPEIRLLCL